MAISDNIKRLRELTGITQEELASVAEVSRSAVSLWEIGDSQPRMGAIQRMADHFHIRKANIIEDGGMDYMAVAMSGRLYEMLPDEIILSDAERELVRLYRNANAQGRESIMAVARVSSGMDGEIQIGISEAI